MVFFFFSSRRRHTRFDCDWSSDVCSSDLLVEQPEPVTLVTLGPVTGLALALRREPDLVRAKVARHIAMVGNIAARGNTTRYSEFNAWCDPEALDTVLKAGLQIGRAHV